MILEYETDRLVLKILDSSHSDIVLDYYNRNRSFLEPWEVEKKDIFYTDRFQSNQLERDFSDIKNGNLLRLWIFKKSDRSKTIGNIAFSNIIRGHFLSCHLGYKLDIEEMKKGYITEAIKEGIKIIFDEYGLHRIEANIMPRNLASLRVTEKLGFLNEGISKKYIKINGKWEDHIHMVLLNDNID